MRNPSLVVGFIAATSLFARSLAGPCRAPTSTTSTIPTTITTSTVPATSTTSTVPPTSTTSTVPATSTTSTAPDTITTFSAVVPTTNEGDTLFLEVRPGQNGAPPYLGTISDLVSTYQIATLSLEPSTNRLMAAGVYFYSRPATGDSTVYTGSASYIDSSAGTIYAAAYIQCNTPLVLGAVIQCTLEGSTKTQFRVPNPLVSNTLIYIGDPTVLSTYSPLQLTISEATT